MRTKTYCKNKPLQLASLPKKKSKKKKTQVRKKYLVNVRSPIMLHFVPLKLIPDTRLSFFFFCYRLNASEALHSNSLLQAHRCMTHSNVWGIFGKKTKMPKETQCTQNSWCPHMVRHSPNRYAYQ